MSTLKTRMKKEINHITSDALERAQQTLRNGDLIGLPTETVYGLAANALSDKAVAKIYTLKERPRFNPLIAHFPNAAEAQKYVHFNEWAKTLSETFWPGPLTLILKKKEDCGISLLATAGLDTLAVRVPAHPIAQLLLQGLEFPLVAPSANPSESLSPTTAQHVKRSFPDLLVVDGGSCTVGLESTIVDLTGNIPVILRPGLLTKNDIEKALLLTLGDKAESNVIKAPGQLKRHYAPSIPLRLNIKNLHEGEALLSFGPHTFTARKEINLSLTCNLEEAAGNLFAALAELDSSQYKGIAVMPIPNDGIGLAVNDRLNRASA